MAAVLQKASFALESLGLLPNAHDQPIGQLHDL